MGDARQCSQCGARPTNVAGVYCEFCGTELPTRDNPQVQVIGPHGDLDARFAALDQHEDVPQLQRYTPDTNRPGTSIGCSIIFGGIFTAVAIFMTFMFGQVAGFVAIFPALFGLFGIGIMVKGITDSVAYSKAPMKRMKVCLVDERSKVSGGGKNSSASTSYFATVQTHDGERGEYRVNEQLAGQIARGDFGIAYFKGRYMLDFKRVDV